MRSRRIRAVTASVAVAVALVGFLAGPAAAQDGNDPYGGTSTTAGGPTAAATCELSTTSGAVGASVTATVRNVPFGATVRILFGGREVGRATAPDQSQGHLTTLSIDFVVPDVEPGSYLVTAVGADFTAVCSPETGGQFRVLAKAASRGGGGSLARTGMYVLLLLAIAAVLVLVGRALVEESRRRRDVERDARRAANHRHRREHRHPPVSK